MSIVKPMSLNRPLDLRKSLGLCFLTAQWLLVAPTAPAADSPALSIKATGVTGTARYEDKNHPGWTDLHPGDALIGYPVLQTNLKDSTADIELVGPDARGPVWVRMFSNTLLREVRLNPTPSRSTKRTGILLDVAAGQIRISLNGASDYAFTLVRSDSGTRVTVPQTNANPNQIAFVFDGSLTVLKGTIQASVGGGREKLIHAGEQLRRGASEVTKTPPEAPELRLDQ